MQNRWARVGVVVAVLVAVNFGARIVLRIASGASEDAELRTGIVTLAAMGVVIAVASFLTARRYLPAITSGDLFFDVVVTSLLVTLVGPFVSGGTPFVDGPGQWLIQILVCVGVLLVGAALGAFLAIALGLDPKSRAWGAYANQVKLPANAKRPGKARTKPVKR
ncbi:hypothetical protein [Cryptosporangium phraense]|uniref:Uncharacterized protein n=1 Tax=Cryptosporangium phraense TaxID=2593070 RepID=A0A545AZ94_9ACTN|nr:hypothetical protein [Cryptosporangium phraense]TQS46618.1 hypothetical protein FL583_04355 [Cryptosporangium phraense]